MKVRFASTVFALVLLVAVAPGLASASPLPQDGIAPARDDQGQIVFVNASVLPQPARSPVKFPGSLQPAPEIRQLIGQTSRSLQVDPGLVDAVMRVESGYQPGARSAKGALGLMQLIPATAARFGVQDPFDPAENIRGGVTYLGQLLKLFDGSVPLTLAAYNAGEGAVQRYGGIPPFEETRNYVRKVTALYPSPAATPGQGAGGAVQDAAGANAAGISGLPGGNIAAASGDRAVRKAARDNPVSPVPIYRYVDSEGNLHFAQ